MQPSAGPVIFESPGQRTSTAARAPTAVTPSAPQKGPSPDLAARCYRIVQDDTAFMLQGLRPGDAKTFVGAQEWLRMCRESAAAHGSPGVDCFASVFRRMLEFVKSGVNP